jgi:hypothetical protein
VRIRKELYLGGVLAFSCFLLGCQSPPRRPRTQTIGTEATRNNCYSLLHQLLSEEKDISKLRFIKRENIDLKDLLKRIAGSANAGATQLETFARQDPSLVLDDYRLPPGEEKTRADIGSQKEKELLHSSGDKLEFTLLLTQNEALNYASHLAHIAAQNDFRPERSQFLEGLSREMATLYDEVTARLTFKKGPPIRSQ